MISRDISEREIACVFQKKIPDDVEFEVTQTPEPHPEPEFDQAKTAAIEPVEAAAAELKADPDPESEAEPPQLEETTSSGTAGALEKSMVKPGVKVWLTKDPTQKGTITKKAGTNAYVDFSESGGDVKKVIPYKQLSTMDESGAASPPLAPDPAPEASTLEPALSEQPAGKESEADFESELADMLADEDEPEPYVVDTDASSPVLEDNPFDDLDALMNGLTGDDDDGSTSPVDDTAVDADEDDPFAMLESMLDG